MNRYRKQLARLGGHMSKVVEEVVGCLDVGQRLRTPASVHVLVLAPNAGAPAVQTRRPCYAHGHLARPVRRMCGVFQVTFSRFHA